MKKSPQPRLKLIIRRLPPLLPVEIFQSTISKWSHSICWSLYIPGKAAKSQSKEDVHSRAYLTFSNPSSLLEFVAAYNGHMFRDKQGVQYQAIVEFAPFQRYIPFEKKNRIDQYMNTIEDDENYIQFLASMNDEPTEPQEEILQYEKETPLLLALRNEKLKRQKKAKKPKPTPVLVTNEPVKDTKKESIQGKKKKRPKKGEDKNNSGNLGKQDKNSLGKQQGQKSTKNDPQPKLVLQLSSKN